MPVTLEVAVGAESCRLVGTLAVAGPTFDGLTIVMLVVTLGL